MPIELGVWRIDEGLQRMEISALKLESRLEDILAQDITIASPNWMVIGRQVRTSYEKYIDLLAIDPDGNLVVLELKRDKTYKDIVAQVLDYGSWINELRSEDVAQIFDAYLRKYHPERSEESIDEAFCKRFDVSAMPDELNGSHELVIVASSLDASTERIVRYLAEQYDVQIDAVFFHVFKDGDRQYLSRAWLSEPTLKEPAGAGRGPKGPWNGEYYASYSDNRSWADAVKYGYFSAGGGSWYSNTLKFLEPGARIWVNIPGVGYVGVGKVVETLVMGSEFIVEKSPGETVLLSEMPLENPRTVEGTDPEKAEYFVRVDWVKTVPKEQAIKEKGFFGNQNSVAKPKAKKWQHTVARLKKRFGVV